MNHAVRHLIELGLDLTAMECSCCGQVRSKRFWTRGQWASGRSVFNGYIGCYSCREASENGYQSLPCLQHIVAVGLASCMDELLHHVSVHAEATSQWDAFMDAWRMNVLREKKKKLLG